MSILTKVFLSFFLPVSGEKIPKCGLRCYSLFFEFVGQASLSPEGTKGGGTSVARDGGILLR